MKPSEFGTRLRQLREAAGLTQEELAERAGLTAQGVSALERGHRRRPYPNTVRALAAALGGNPASFGALIASRASVADLPGQPAGPPFAVPTAPTRLIGRERNVVELRGLLTADDTRLVSVIGPGGVGKTRLAQQAASTVASAFPNGVAFVSLASLGNQDLVVPAIGYAVGLRDAGPDGWLRLLGQYLRERRVLIVLDNCEHVLDAAPDIAGLLRDCPQLTILATSRAPLRVRGERVYQLGPLAVLPDGQCSTLQEALASPAAQLFLERARDCGGREWTDSDAPALAAICRRLDGLPLALELTANWVRVLPPTALAARLQKAVPLVSEGPRDLPERQRTLRATLDWSHQLLKPAEQVLFRRLSVFVGGLTLAAAEAVLTDQQISSEAAIDLMAGLVEHSLVTVETNSNSESPRYRLLEPIRQYASELLGASSESEFVRDRQAAFLTALASAARLELWHADQVAWLRQLSDEHDNVRLAITWLLERGDVERVAQIGWGLFQFWTVRGHSDEGRQWIERALSQASAVSPKTRAQLLVVMSTLALSQGDLQRANAAAESGLAEAVAAGLDEILTFALLFRGLVAFARGDAEAADEMVSRALPLAGKQEKSFVSTNTFMVLGNIALNRGNFDSAAELFTGAQTVCREASDWYSLCIVLLLSGLCERLRGHLERADALLCESARLGLMVGFWGLTMNATMLASVAALRGQGERAARLLGAVDNLREKTGLQLMWTESRELMERDLNVAREQLGTHQFERARAEGRALDPEAVLAEAWTAWF